MDMAKPAARKLRQRPSLGVPQMRDMLDEAADAAQLLKLLGNKHRLLILCCLLIRDEMAVSEMGAAIGLSQSALSQHLARLRADGLVTFRRAAQVLHYRIADRRVGRLIDLLRTLYCETAT